MTTRCSQIELSKTTNLILPPQKKEHFLCHAANMSAVVNVWVWCRNRLKKKTNKPVPIEFYLCVFFGRARSVISSPHRGHPDFRLENTSSRRSPCVHSVQRNIRANQRGKDPLSSLPLIYRAWTLREADLSFHLNDYAVRWWGLLHNNIASHSKSTRGPRRTEKKKKDLQLESLWKITCRCFFESRYHVVGLAELRYAQLFCRDECVCLLCVLRG